MILLPHNSLLSSLHPRALNTPHTSLFAMPTSARQNAYHDQPTFLSVKLFKKLNQNEHAEKLGMQNQTITQREWRPSQIMRTSLTWFYTWVHPISYVKLFRRCFGRYGLVKNCMKTAYMRVSDLAAELYLIWQIARPLLVVENERFVQDFWIVVRSLAGIWINIGDCHSPYSCIVCVVITASIVFTACESLICNGQKPGIPVCYCFVDVFHFRSRLHNSETFSTITPCNSQSSAMIRAILLL